MEGACIAAWSFRPLNQGIRTVAAAGYGRSNRSPNHEYHLVSCCSLSLTFIIALPNLFSPHLSRFSRASAAPKPTPQMRSVGDAFAAVSKPNIAPDGGRNDETYFNKLAIAGTEQHLRQLTVILAFGELVPIAFFNDTILVCPHQISFKSLRQKGTPKPSRSSHLGLENPFAFLPSA